MSERTVPYVLTNQDSTAFWLIDNLWMPLATTAHTANRFSLMEQVCGTGIGGPQAHMHPSDEGMYILEGHCTYQAAGQHVEAGPGTFVSIPRHTAHSFTVDAPGTRLLNFYTPAGFEHFIMSLALPAQERKAPPPGSTPMPPRWMALEASYEFGQIAAPTMPIADPPDEENRVTEASEVNLIQPFAIMLDQAPAYWMEETLWTVLATAEQTGGSYSLLELLCRGVSGPPPHTHEQDEAIYILEGEITLVAGSRRVRAKAGSFAYVPARTFHTFRVETERARLLNWYLPGGFERIITRFATPAAARTLPPAQLEIRGTQQQLRAAQERAGMTNIAAPDFLRTGNDDESAA